MSYWLILSAPCQLPCLRKYVDSGSLDVSATLKAVVSNFVDFPPEFETVKTGGDDRGAGQEKQQESIRGIFFLFFFTLEFWSEHVSVRFRPDESDSPWRGKKRILLYSFVLCVSLNAAVSQCRKVDSHRALHNRYAKKRFRFPSSIQDGGPFPRNSLAG